MTITKENGQPSAQPEGMVAGEWVMVPRVPTEAMLDAYVSVASYRSDEDLKRGWSAMLAATPPAPLRAAELEPIVACMAEMLADPALDALAFDKHDSRIIYRALTSAPLRADAGEVGRQCTCHPDDQPSSGCQSRYAASECQNAASDAGEERDALLAALGWKTGPFSDELSRKVILDDSAGLRTEMVKARRAAQESEADRDLYRWILGDVIHGSRSGLLARLWEALKSERRERKKLVPTPSSQGEEAAPWKGEREQVGLSRIKWLGRPALSPASSAPEGEIER